MVPEFLYSVYKLMGCLIAGSVLVGAYPIAYHLFGYECRFPSLVDPPHSFEFLAKMKLILAAFLYIHITWLPELLKVCWYEWSNASASDASIFEDGLRVALLVLAEAVGRFLIVGYFWCVLRAKLHRLLGDAEERLAEYRRLDPAGSSAGEEKKIRRGPSDAG